MGKHVENVSLAKRVMVSEIEEQDFSASTVGSVRATAEQGLVAMVVTAASMRTTYTCCSAPTRSLVAAP